MTKLLRRRDARSKARPYGSRPKPCPKASDYLETREREKRHNAFVETMVRISSEISRDGACLTAHDVRSFMRIDFDEMLQGGAAQRWRVVQDQVELAFFDSAYSRVDIGTFLSARPALGFKGDFPGTTACELIEDADLNLALQKSQTPLWIDAACASGQGALDLAQTLVTHSASVTHVALSNCDTVKVFTTLQRLLADTDRELRWEAVYIETSQPQGEFEHLGLVFALLAGLRSLRKFRWVCHGFDARNHPADAPWWFVPMSPTFPATLKMAKNAVDVKVMTTFFPQPVSAEPEPQEPTLLPI